MLTRPMNVLFLCTGNTARSILAEGILNALGSGRFRAYSAGSQPKGVVNPFAIRALHQAGFAVEDLRSKSWDEFAAPDAPEMDFIFTVCDNAAGEACPFWPGRPASAHWGIEDPAAVAGPEAVKQAAFAKAFDEMHARIAAFVGLPLEQLSAEALSAELVKIGQLSGATRI